MLRKIKLPLFFPKCCKFCLELKSDRASFLAETSENPQKIRKSKKLLIVLTDLWVFKLCGIQNLIPQNWSTHNIILQTEPAFKFFQFFCYIPTCTATHWKINVYLYTVFVIRIPFTQFEYSQNCILQTKRRLIFGFSNFLVISRLFRHKQLSILDSEQDFECFEKYFDIPMRFGGLECYQIISSNTK